MSLAPLASAQPVSDRPKVAVVLSGGGAKGVAHIEALRAVEQAGLPIDIVCGTSMGSLIGALYCVGYSTDFLDSLVRSQDWPTLLSDRIDPSELTLQQRREQNTYAIIRALSQDRPQQGGLIRGRNLMRLFRTLCSGFLDSINFDSLPVRFACVATDLLSDSEVDFRSGYLTMAMRASMAIPGVFTPVRMGNRVLVDGGLSNNYPVDLARAMGADIVIGMNVADEPLRADDIKDAASVMSQIIDNNCKKKLEENIAATDVFMRVDVSGYSAASFTSSAIDSLLSRGREEASRHRDELLLLAARLKLAPDHLPKHPSRNVIPTPLGNESETSAPRARPAESSIAHSPIASVGLRYDSEESAAVLLNLKAPLPTEFPLGAEAMLRLGRQLRAGARLLLLSTGFSSPSLSYSFARHDVDIYSKGLRSYNVKYRQHTVNFAPVNFRLQNYTFSLGIRMDNYKFYSRLISASDLTSFNLDHELYFSYHLSANFNTENHWYFPDHGVRMNLSLAYRTDNFLGLNSSVGLSDLSADWRVNLSPSSRITIQPMFYGRLLIFSDVPPVYCNFAGSEWFGHNIEQQMPFPGIGLTEFLDNQFIAAQLQLQYHLLKNHYLLLRAAAALQASSVVDLLQAQSSSFFGLQAGYSYNSFFGPIDLRLGYSSRTSDVFLYINLGHCF